MKQLGANNAPQFPKFLRFAPPAVAAVLYMRARLCRATCRVACCHHSREGSKLHEFNVVYVKHGPPPEDALEPYTSNHLQIDALEAWLPLPPARARGGVEGQVFRETFRQHCGAVQLPIGPAEVGAVVADAGPVLEIRQVPCSCRACAS